MSEKQIRANINVLRKERNKVISEFLSRNPGGIQKLALVHMKRQPLKVRIDLAFQILRGAKKVKHEVQE